MVCGFMRLERGTLGKNMKNKTAIIPGSLTDIAAKQNVSIAESFVDCDVLVIVDVSGSMAVMDSRDGQKRYDVALQELEELQRTLPGKLAILAFSNVVIFVPSGKPPFLGMGTNLAGALKFARMADVPGMRFFVISDGIPDNQQAALAEAAKIKASINCIYVGPEGGPGQRFLEQLASANQGVFGTADRVKNLAAITAKMLSAG